jgi:hypothetical protein
MNITIPEPTRAADWLSRFEAVGGSYAMNGNEVRFFWAIARWTEAQNVEARRLYNLLDANPYLWADVTATIEARSAREVLS